MRVAIHEGKHGHGVVGIKAMCERSIVGYDRCHDEFEPGPIVKSIRRAQRKIETLVCDLPRAAEPVLVVEIIDSHEVRLTALVDHFPVIAAPSLSDVCH